MKLHRVRSFVLLIAFIGVSIGTFSQQVNTLYFLENAPMRHTINPAFQPVSNFYFTLPVIGYTSVWLGGNSLTMSDIIFTNESGQTITALHPSVKGDLWKKLPKMLTIDADIHTNILSFGWRVHDKGYAHFNISERIAFGAGIPKTIFGNTEKIDLANINLTLSNASASVYTDISFGYSHNINDQWTVGAKLKLLLGQTYARGIFDQLSLTSSPEIASLIGEGRLQMAGIVEDIVIGGINDSNSKKNILSYIKPAGYGGAVDLGVTYKPITNLQITAAVSDLGIIHWNNSSAASLRIDTTFTGFGDFVYEDYVHNGSFQTNSFVNDIKDNLSQYRNILHITDITAQSFNQVLNAHLNVGIDANFWKNRIGVGIYSHTRFHNKSVSEELTLGAAFRPFNWFHLATSYSFMNGKWSNIGAAISIATYDIFMLTIAADYVPLSYAYLPSVDKYILPYKTSGFNIAFGIAIVTGTNGKRKKATKDMDQEIVREQNLLEQPIITSDTSLYTLTDTITLPIDSTTLPLDTITLPLDTTTLPLDTITLPLDTTTLSLDTIILPLDTTTLSLDTITLPIDSTTLPLDTITLPLDTTTLSLDTIVDTLSITTIDLAPEHIQSLEEATEIE
jgi:hypothetical protein